MAVQVKRLSSKLRTILSRDEFPIHVEGRRDSAAVHITNLTADAVEIVGCLIWYVHGIYFGGSLIFVSYSCRKQEIKESYIERVERDITGSCKFHVAVSWL